ncbi:hypothetical protein APSETT445_009316 [Aspergillus pseudonomiae]
MDIYRNGRQRLIFGALGTIPGMHMVDIFTWLNYLPLCLKPWERDARKRFKRDLEWCMARLERIKDPAFAGQYMADAFLPSVIQAPDRGGFTAEEEAAYLSLQLIIGAADTSINSSDVTKRDHFAFGAGRRICTSTTAHWRAYSADTY